MATIDSLEIFQEQYTKKLELFLQDLGYDACFIWYDGEPMVALDYKSYYHHDSELDPVELSKFSKKIISDIRENLPEYGSMPEKVMVTCSFGTIYKDGDERAAQVYLWGLDFNKIWGETNGWDR